MASAGIADGGLDKALLKGKTPKRGEAEVNIFRFPLFFCADMKKTEGIFCPPDQNVKAVEIYVVLVWRTLYNSYIRVFDDVELTYSGPTASDRYDSINIRSGIEL